MQKRKKLRTLGKSRSTESEDEENEEEEGKQIIHTLPADLFGVIGHITCKMAPGEVGV